MQKIKVLHILSQLSTGGVETWLLNVYRQVDKELIEFHFLTSSMDKGVYDDEIIGLGGVIYYFDPSKNPIVLYSRVKKIVSKADIGIIHSHVYAFGAAYSLIGYFIGVPVIVHSHTTRPPVGFFKKIYYAVASKAINKLATKKLACTEDAGNALFRGGSCDIVSYGVNSTKFYPNLNAKVRIVIPENTKVVGHVGRFLDVKNQEFIIKMASKMNKGFCFVLVGTGPNRSKIFNLIKENKLDNVKLLEPRKDVNLLFSKVFDLLILPSKFEGLGIVTLEAQSVGIPVIVSDNVPDEAKVIDELFQKIPLSSLDQWVSAIRSCKKYSDEQRITFNKVFSESRFSLSSSVRLLVEQYRSISKVG